MTRKVCLSFVALFLSGVVYADMEMAVSYRDALSAGKKLMLKKDKFQTWDDFTRGAQIDCDKIKSPLCRRVEISVDDRFLTYSPEREAVQFLGFNSSYRPTDHFAFSGADQFCVLAEVVSNKDSKYIAANVFGAKTTVYKTDFRARGIVFTSSSWKCFDDNEMLDFSVSGSNLRDPYLKVSRDDARLERGKFLTKIVAIPISPYILSMSYQQAPTYTSPSEVRSILDGLLVKPLELQFLGAVTKKIYKVVPFN